MDNKIKQVNVEEIMTEIRREIKEKGYKDKDILFADIPINSLDGGITHSGVLEVNLRMLNSRYAIAAYRPLITKRALGFIVIFIKKIIRKMTKFYIEPIVADQNESNRLMALCLQDLYLENNEMRSKIKYLEDDVNRLKEKLDDS